MSHLIQPLVDIFDFNTMTVSVSLADLDNEDAGQRMRQGDGSSITFLAGHLISTRHVMLQLLRAIDDNPYLAHRAGISGGAGCADAAHVRADLTSHYPLSEILRSGCS
ncbi:MAG: hypothetical protein GY719_27675 [bacterium]|nr:hypothetical protein [bacterium]